MTNGNGATREYIAVAGSVESKMPHPMPISIMFWAGPGSESDVIKAASAYEAAAHHRVPPPAFGPVAVPRQNASR
jgi:amidase